MSNKHRKKQLNIPQRNSQGTRISRPHVPQPKGYETPKEWMQFLGSFALSVADAALTVSSEAANNESNKAIGNAPTDNKREQPTGAIDIDRYSSLENSINTLRDSNIKEHNTLRQEWRQDIRNTKQDLEKLISQNKEDANNGIESSKKHIDRFLSGLAIVVAFFIGILGFIFKCTDDNIIDKADNNKAQIRENRSLIDENRERVIKLEEQMNRQRPVEEKTVHQKKGK